MLDRCSDANLLACQYVGFGKTNTRFSLGCSRSRNSRMPGGAVWTCGETKGTHRNQKPRTYLSTRDSRVFHTTFCLKRDVPLVWRMVFQTCFMEHQARRSPVKNISLVIKGARRRVPHARHAPASAPINYKRDLGRSWARRASGFLICLRPSLAFVSPNV